MSEQDRADRYLATTLRALARQLRDRADENRVHPEPYGLGLRDAALHLTNEAEALDPTFTDEDIQAGLDALPHHGPQFDDNGNPTGKLPGPIKYGSDWQTGLIHGPRLGGYINLEDTEGMN